MKKSNYTNGLRIWLSSKAADYHRFGGVKRKVSLQTHSSTDVGKSVFWDKYRSGGELEGFVPTVGNYNRAVYDSLVSAGVSKGESAYAVRIAYGQQKAYGLSNSSPVPRIPNRMYQAK